MTKVIRSDSKKSLGLPVNGPVFWSSTLIIVIIIGITLAFHARAQVVFSNIQSAVSVNAGWLMIISVNIFLVFGLFLAFSKFGRIRLGGPKARPEFSTTSWFAMLFSAGMGIGLLFWSIAEPVSHFNLPPTGDGGTVESARMAMNVTFLHWGLHAWGIYALVGLSLAYFTYSRKLPLTIRSIFYPFLGDRIHGRLGDIIDILAVLATLFGLATSLGLGVKQIASGINHVVPAINNTVITQIVLIGIITAVATISVVLGIDKGVRFLSVWNIRVAMVLLLAIFFLGPTVFILQAFVQNTGQYFSSLMEWAFWNEAYSDEGWQMDWTVFYWGWWIAWSPFVGMFIARVSKGRTVREFVLGVLVVPTLLTFFWITTFGSTALRDLLAGNDTIAFAVAADVSTALFVFFESFPFSTVLSVIGVILVAGFFVTSSDSGSLVIDSLTTGGKIESAVGLRIFWAVSEGAVAAVLLLGGGLHALQAASIVTGLPFTLLLLIMTYSLYKGLKEEVDLEEKAGRTREKKAYQELVAEMIARRKIRDADSGSETNEQETKKP
jgi:choline/glycine/proline betaine transport protein